MRYFFNAGSDVVGNGDAQAVSNFLLSDVDCIGTRPKKLLREVLCLSTLQYLFLPILRLSSSTGSGLPLFMRWGGYFPYYNGCKCSDGGSIPRTWMAYCMYILKERMWP